MSGIASEAGCPTALAPSPSPHRVLIFAVISLALLMSSLDQTIVATALHALQHGLGASITWTGWTITGYSFGLVLMLPLAGKLSDRYGRRRVFLASVVVFTLASLCCGLADDIYLLVALRVVQAIGGAGFTPAATGIVVEHFGGTRDRAVGLFGSIFPIGAMIGPVVGGLIVSNWSWRIIFFVNVPIGLLLVPLCLRFVPADAPRESGRHERLDAVGIALLGIGLLAVMIALTYLGDAGPDRLWPVLGGAVVAAVAITGFLRHIARVTDPIIEPRLIHGRGFGAVNLVNVICGGTTVGLLALVPLYATTRYGISALGSGTLLTAQGLASILVSGAAAFALRRTGYHLPIYIGTGVIVVGMVGLWLAPPGGLSPYLWLSLAAFLVGIGMGGLSPASRNAGLQLAPEHSATIAALRTTGMQIGSIAAISVATAVIAQSAHPASAQSLVFLALAALLVAAAPIVARIPEHRGSW